MLITDTCTVCKSMCRSLPRIGCRVCFEEHTPLPPGHEAHQTFCSETCLEKHRVAVHAGLTQEE